MTCEMSLEHSHEEKHWDKGLVNVLNCMSVSLN